MDNRSFNALLAKATGNDVRQTTRLSKALTQIIGKNMAEGINIAVPGFGEFRSVKENEHIVTDPKSGERTLLPPSITVRFKAGSRLRKNIAKS